ncbi:MAG: hypothetical protein ACHQWV_05075, partial [Nitrospirales bacterium]
MQRKRERTIMPGKAALNSVEPPLTRKKFLELAGLATLGTVLTAAANAQQKTQQQERQKRYGMVIDLQRCVACRACTVACKQENKTPPGVLYTSVSEQEVGEFPNVKRISIPS